MDFHSTNVFGVKEADNCVNFKAGAIIHLRDTSQLTL
jgi:hypothetical protein